MPNVNDMLTQVRNVHGDRLNYLYFVYRIASFDTHGKSLGTIFEAVFAFSREVQESLVSPQKEAPP